MLFRSGIMKDIEGTRIIDADDKVMIYEGTLSKKEIGRKMRGDLLPAYALMGLGIGIIVLSVLRKK